MDDSNLLNTLLTLGLSENEARVYLGALSLGSSTVAAIAAASGVKRTTVYSVMESLKQRGLLAVEVQGFKKRYLAAHPRQLKLLLAKQQAAFSESFSEFESLYNRGGSESFIKHFEGMESIQAVYDSLLRDVRPGQDYLVIGEVRQWFRLAPDFFADFLKRRSKLPIRVRVLLTHNKPDNQWYAEGVSGIRQNEELRVLPEGTHLSTNLVVIPQRVLIQQLVPPVMAMEIENKSLVQMHTETFEILWEHASAFC